MYHMCKTWSKEVHSGWEMVGGGGVIVNKIYKVN